MSGKSKERSGLNRLKGCSPIWILWLSALSACQPASGAGGSTRYADQDVCEDDRVRLGRFIERLPDRAIATNLQVELPRSNLGEIVGQGPVLEISKQAVRLNGIRILGRTMQERARNAGEAVARLPGMARAERGTAAPAPSYATAESNRRFALYVAAARELDVRTLRTHLAQLSPALDLKLLLAGGAAAGSSMSAESEKDEARFERLFRETEPAARQELAEQAYARYSSCDAFTEAVHSVRSLQPSERWSALKQRLVSALPRCSCRELDAPNLQRVLLAEQRAGASALSAIAGSFLRDPRCEASMPLRSVEKLVRQIEQFDEEFAGQVADDALEFSRVLTNERLLNYFCDALPGETLAALQRAGAPVFWRDPSLATCQKWQFFPISKGAPMGTLKRIDDSPAGRDLQLHYWQGAEQIRLYGPVRAETLTKPTDRRDWVCSQNYRMMTVDSDVVALDHGHWFFTEEACRRAPPDKVPHPEGCISELTATGLNSPDAAATSR